MATFGRGGVKSIRQGRVQQTSGRNVAGALLVYVCFNVQALDGYDSWRKTPSTSEPG